MSISFTKYITIRMAHLCGKGELKNLFIFLIMLFVNYMLLGFWYHITSSIRRMAQFILIDPFSFSNVYTIVAFFLIIGVEPGVLSLANPAHLFDDIFITPNVDNFAFAFLSLFSNIFRITASIIFIGSFLLKPLVMRPVSLLWARIVESDKPVFTLILGGAAAFATAIGEAAKHLPG